jgi:uncharacterized repeat protein (TIGR03803 family)
MSNAWFLRKLGLCLLLCALFTPAAYAQFSVLYTYGSNPGDPGGPFNTTRIAQGRDGDLYTTGNVRGATGNGAAFKITPSGALTVLYSFCSQAACTDGQSPRGGLTLGTDGNFYGTTNLGGSGADAGVIFQMTSTGGFKVLYTFTNGADGGAPWAPPVEGLDGNFYGTTSSGGGHLNGTIYKITPTGTFTVIHTFGSASVDTAGPRAPLVLGTDGNFYGTGSFGAYVTFKVTPAGKYTPLTPNGQVNGMYGPLIQGTSGSFYGAASNNNIFRMSSSGGVTILHTLNGTTEGNGPGDGVIQASDGNFYGTTQSGGTSTNCTSNLGTCGVLFKVTPSGTDTTLHDFEDPDGYEPTAVIQHTNGIIYGQNTFGGGASNAGTFWQWNNGLKPFVSFMPFTGHVGDKIQIFGQGFTGSSVVKFNGVAATSITVTGTTFITATVPQGTLDGYITVTTGGTTLTSLYKFLVHDSWGSGTPLPTPIRYPAGVGAINGKIYVVGGSTTGDVIIPTTQVYNTMTKKWTTAAPMPAALLGGTGAVVKNILYVIGGYNGTGVVNTVYAYNPANNIWSSKSPMPTARSSIGSAVKNGVVYVIGGVNGDGHTRYNINESYNAASNTWTTEAPMLVGKSEVSVGLMGTTIVAAGGFTTSGDTGDNEGYNSTANSWKSLATDPNPRHDSCYGVIGGFFYIAGGGLSPVSTNESYSVTTNKWASLSGMPVATTAPGSVVANGQLFCFGGGDSTGPTGGNYYNNVQIYEP